METLDGPQSVKCACFLALGALFQSTVLSPAVLDLAACCPKSAPEVLPRPRSARGAKNCLTAVGFLTSKFRATSRETSTPPYVILVGQRRQPTPSRQSRPSRRSTLAPISENAITCDGLCHGSCVTNWHFVIGFSVSKTTTARNWVAIVLIIAAL